MDCSSDVLSVDDELDVQQDHQNRYWDSRFEIPRETLELVVGVVSKRQKIATLKRWKLDNEDIRGREGKFLIEMTRDFLGILHPPDDGNLPFDVICQAVIDAIPHDSWMRFVRLKLELDENVIKALHHQYAEFSVEQKYQIARRLVLQNLA